MKKKGSARKLHVIVVSLTLSIVVCMLAFLSLQLFSPSHSQITSLSRRSLHYNWEDSITPDDSFQGNPKVAVLFLARRYLPLDFLWKCFFEDIDKVYYFTEYRTELCHNNSTLVSCFLFARKFSLGVAMCLLSEGVVSQFDASAIIFIGAFVNNASRLRIS